MSSGSFCTGAHFFTAKVIFEGKTGAFVGGGEKDWSGLMDIDRVGNRVLHYMEPVADEGTLSRCPN